MRITHLGAAALALISLVSVARADDVDELPFDELQVCRGERDAAHLADRPPPSDAGALAHVARARADLAGATDPKMRKLFKRALDEALADLANVRAAQKTAIARREASAKALADCVERERADYAARFAARRAEEQRKAAAEAAEKERIEKLMNDVPTMRLALSALVCLTRQDRADALRDIADEKKYARVGGVQNNAKIYELEQDVRAADRRAAWFAGELKRRKLAAIGCGDRLVKLTAACVRAAKEGPCLDDRVAGPLDVVGNIELGAPD